ncbi:MAG: hypothetical protein GXP46_01470 [Deferribacteres bacterium]|nr:hypothetical protein [Deferribacteres bacterium]
MKNNVLPEFQHYPRSKRLVKEKNITFTLQWQKNIACGAEESAGKALSAIPSGNIPHSI